MASSSNSEFESTYDIFLSFRGLDTRIKFIDHLYMALKREGFDTFNDDEIPTGNFIKPELRRAIMNSRMSVVVLSKNYANSTACLFELQLILARAMTSYHLVLPVFFEVDPQEINQQAKNLDFGEKKVTEEEVKGWSEALKEVSRMAGMVSQYQSGRYEARFIEKIVGVLKNKLACNHPRVAYNGVFKRQLRNIKHWQKGNFLGSGSFGAVYEGLTDDGFFFAVKEVSLLDQGHQGKQSIRQLQQEISLLSKFEHENIVKYIGTDKDDSKLYIFLELITKGSLSNLYQQYNLHDSQVSAYTRQILNGLNYLHCQNVVHRDIKCANILVDASGSVKLADFGLAKVTKLNDLKSLQGTVFWMAPEVANQENHQGYGLAADIWSLGCTVLEMLTRKIPYSHLEEGMRVIFRIAKGELPHIPSSLSEDARDFIFRCLKVNPGDRPTAAQLLNHPFVKLSSSLSPSSAYHNGKRKQALMGW